MKTESLYCENNTICRDVVLVGASVCVAVFLVKIGALEHLLASTRGMVFVESFIAGLFFTTVFTTAPAVAFLGEIAQANSLLWTALWGGCGALVGDLVLFHFVKQNVSRDFLCLLGTEKSKRFKAILKFSVVRWVLPLLGAIIIASPFPDEIGLALMGFSKMSTRMFIPISFCFNFLGIVLIGLVALNRCTSTGTPRCFRPDRRSRCRPVGPLPGRRPRPTCLPRPWLPVEDSPGCGSERTIPPDPGEYPDPARW
jgi:hypothetical protein